MCTQTVAQLGLCRRKPLRAFRVLQSDFSECLTRAVLDDNACLTHRPVEEPSNVAVERRRHLITPYEITIGPRFTAATRVARWRPSHASTSGSERTTVPRSIIARCVCGADSCAA